MPDNKKNLTAAVCDLVVLLFIGIAAVLYSVFRNNFAELNIKLSFLNFPVFIGEILLFVCVTLTAIKGMVNREKLPLNYSWLILYMLFVFCKAFYGYYKFGPLAFRDAAMFLYPLFAAIVYYAFRKEFFKFWVRAGLFVVVLCLVFFFYLTYFLYLYVLLGLVLAMSFENKKLRYLSVSLVLLLTPYGKFIDGCRAILVGAFFSSIALFFALFKSIELPKLDKKVFIFCIIAGLIVVFGVFGRKGSVHSLIKPQDFFNFAKEGLNEVEAQKETFKFAKITPRLYNPQGGVDFEGDVFSERAERAVGGLNNETVGGSAGRKISHDIGGGKDFVCNAGHLKYATMLFRVFVIMDVFDDFLREKPVLGFDFGKPFRSKRVEISGSAYGEWSRDGWITMHNTYLNLIYRSGLFGIFLLVIFLRSLFQAHMFFLRIKYIQGIFLVNTLFFWLITGLFNVLFEVPYFAVPFWSLFGLILVVWRDKARAVLPGKPEESARYA